MYNIGGTDEVQISLRIVIFVTIQIGDPSKTVTYSSSDVAVLLFCFSVTFPSYRRSDYSPNGLLCIKLGRIRKSESEAYRAKLDRAPALSCSESVFAPVFGSLAQQYHICVITQVPCYVVSTPLCDTRVYKLSDKSRPACARPYARLSLPLHKVSRRGPVLTCLRFLNYVLKSDRPGVRTVRGHPCAYAVRVRVSICFNVTVAAEVKGTRRVICQDTRNYSNFVARPPRALSASRCHYNVCAVRFHYGWTRLPGA